MSVKRTSVAGRSRRPKPGQGVRITKTGLRIFLRPIRIDDKELLHSFAETLSAEALYFRFFRHIEPTEDLLQKLVKIDPTEQRAVLALVGRGKTDKIVGVGRSFMDHESVTAEVIVTVAGDYQNKGIGRELLLYLIHIAKEQGLKSLTAQVLADNVAMLRLLRSLEGVEYEIQKRVEAGVFHFNMTFK